MDKEELIVAVWKIATLGVRYENDEITGEELEEQALKELDLVKNLSLRVVVKSCDTCKNLSTCRFRHEAPENGKTCNFYIEHVL